MPPKVDLSLDKITADILAMENNNEPAQTIANYIASRFQTNQNFRIPTAKKIKDDTLRNNVITILENFKNEEINKEVNDVIQNSVKQQEALKPLIDRTQAGILLLEATFKHPNLGDLLTQRNQDQRRTYYNTFYQALSTAGFQSGEIKVIFKALTSHNTKEYKNTSWTNPMASLPVIMNPLIQPGKEKYEVGNIKESFNRNESNDYMLLDRNRKAFLSSLDKDIGNPNKQKEYWDSCNTGMSFEDHIKQYKTTLTCGGGVNKNMIEQGMNPPKNPASSANFKKGPPKPRHEWTPGDIVVYNIRMINGKDVGGHVGVYVGTDKGIPMVWSENIAQNGIYKGPILHPLNNLDQMGISDPHVYGLENFIPQREKVIKFD